MSQQDTCDTCKRKFTDRDKLLECSICKRNFHSHCHGISSTDYGIITKNMNQFHWHCPNCNHGASKLHQEVVALRNKFDKIENKIESLQDQVKVVSVSMETKVQSVVHSSFQDLSQKLQKSLSDQETKIDAAIRSSLNNVKTEIEKSLFDKIEDKCENSIKLDELTNSIKMITEENISKLNICGAVSKEMIDREQRKKNIVIHRMPESTKEQLDEKKKDDLNNCTEILKSLDGSISEDSFSKFFRIGTFIQNKSRPILIEFTTQEQKDSVMKSTTKLKGSKYQNLSICHDLTKIQREEFNKLADEAKKKSTESKTYRVIGQPGFWKVKEKKVT